MLSISQNMPRFQRFQFMAGSTKVHFPPLHFPNQSSRHLPQPFPVWSHCSILSLLSSQPSPAPSKRALCITSASSHSAKAKPRVQHGMNEMCTASPPAIVTEERGGLEVLSTPPAVPTVLRPPLSPPLPPPSSSHHSSTCKQGQHSTRNGRLKAQNADPAA